MELQRISELRKDDVFMGRLTAAIGIVAIMILNESPDSSHHDERLKWALASLKAPESMAEKMFFQIVTDWKIAPSPDIHAVNDDVLRGAVANQFQITMNYSQLLT